ncbi:S1C family serine protease [Enterovirga aerilata]|uniref:Serine protease n=1 Tax=Enterovirga aerilata TaxID=2730920 RepID=A0A849I7Y3_9HYPH|nr:S1C family serine protease [Enterovirga sp. DB1703]NNM72170.1 serine protease [Enterovirga sp. DB1703]
MPSAEWKIPRAAQPRPEDYDFDLDRALGAVMALSSAIPPDAFTADTLGTERAGNAVLIGERGLVLTIGYLITEASTIWLTLNDGRVVGGDVLGYDPESGFGLVQALGRIDVPPLPLGSSAEVRIGDGVVVAGAGGRQRSVAARVIAKQEFAGYWEYLLEEAIFTSPPHPHWGGTALIGGSGHLLGIGSLQLQQDRGGTEENLNMIVPIDLLKPVLADMLATGAPRRAVRPWLGVYATEVDGRVVVAGLAEGGPAETAGLHVGDIVLAVAGTEVATLAELYRQVWSLGQAGVQVPLRIHRMGRVYDVAVPSTDRNRLLKRKILH